MSVRRPRSKFAAPLVITLAMAPACVVRTSAPPPGARPTTGDQRGEPTVMTNPPRPTDGTVGNTPPPTEPGGRPDHATSPDVGGPVEQRPPTPPIKQPDGTTDVAQQGPGPAQLRYWNVRQNADKSCYAMHEASCPPPPATCNPPPPAKLKSCPSGITPGTTMKVRELSPGECFVVHDAPACPAGMACNPPRPAKIDCPPY